MPSEPEAGRRRPGKHPKHGVALDRSPVQNQNSQATGLCDIITVHRRVRFAGIREECAMNLVVLLIILLLLFGGGGFYVGGPRVGGSLGGIILIILLILLLTGRL